MNILILQGSPRANGNTAWMAEEYRKAAEAAGQIYGRCRREGIPMVCAETLYKEYYKRQKLVLAGKSQEILPPLPKRQKKRKTRDRNAKKYRNAGRGR